MTVHRPDSISCESRPRRRPAAILLRSGSRSSAPSPPFSSGHRYRCGLLLPAWIDCKERQEKEGAPAPAAAGVHDCPPAMGLSRRFLNLIVDNSITGAKSLRSIDLRRQKLFNTTPAPTITASAPKGITLALNKIRLPSPSLSIRTSDSDLSDQRIHFFQAADRRVFCLDQLGRGFFLEVDDPRMVMLPWLQRPKLEPISLYVPCAEPDFNDLNGIGSGNLFIMERRVAKPEPGDCGGFQFQFEALVYRKPCVRHFLSKSWHCQPLSPPPPYIHGGAGNSWLEISSYAVVGSQICISVDGDNTYCLADASAVSDTYSWSEVGKWTLPFQGKVHCAPELKLWFGFTAKDQNLAAADLSTMNSHSQPQLLNSWKELEPPKGWQQVEDPQLVSLGSRRFCIARFYRVASPNSGFGNESGYQNVTVLTGVEVARSHGFGGKVNLEMTKHKSLCHKSRCGEDTVTGVF